MDIKELPESLLYVLANILPNIENGSSYCITSKCEDMDKYINEIIKNEDIKIIRPNKDTYILCMNPKKFFWYSQQTNFKFFDKDIKMLYFGPKSKELISLDYYLKTKHGTLTFGLYSVNAVNSIVKGGISYIAFNLTFEEALPLFKKYQLRFKYGDRAVEPEEIVKHLYDGTTLENCCITNRTKTGILFQARKP